MDDFNVSSLHESKNEWGSRLLTILTPHIIDGLRSIFDEALKLCRENNEMDKYLMTFQNFITRIPKWNANIIELERKRIVEKSSCGYLEDLITCVHIIQLKMLTAMRVGNKQKKIDINIPKLDDFIHKIYVNVARKIYKNVYLFEVNIQPLQIQKNHRELEMIVQECILNTVRDSIPIETILQAYMDETVEEDVVEEIREQIIENPNKKEDDLREQILAQQKSSQIISETQPPVITGGGNEGSSKLSFNDVDMARDANNNEVSIEAPKNFKRLEDISHMRNEQRKLEESENNDDDDEQNVKLKIHDQSVNLDSMDIHNIEFPELNLASSDLLLGDIEILA
jgi:hypothetical protein